MADNVHQEKLQGVQTRLTSGESSRQNSQTHERTQFSQSESCNKKTRAKKRRKPSPNNMSRGSYPSQSPSVFSKLKHEEQSSSCLRSPMSENIRRIWRPKGSSQDIPHCGQGRALGHANMVPHVQLYTDRVSQAMKYIKYPVEIHHIKQREGESTEAFMKRSKAESMHVKGALECMRVFGFMHVITNPDLIKRLSDNIPKFMDEMMSITTAFLRDEVVVANQSRKKGPPAWKHHEGTHTPSFDKRRDFKNQ
nr:reverse transcriptase domain-containing protein [Tanacetum cinerariifolium]